MPERERVVARLGASDFGLESSYHGEMAAVGDEARPVLAAPESDPVLSVAGVRPDPDGVVRAEITLPEDVRALPDAAFGLQVQRLPPATKPEMLEKLLPAFTAADMKIAPP